MVERDNLRVRLNYETTENGNAFGDDVQRITGVYCPTTGNGSFIFTRTTQYKIVPKRQIADGVAVDVGFAGGSPAPRSSVNNCTWDPAAGADGLEHANHEVNETVSFDALSQQEKRELLQRLRNGVRTKYKKRLPVREVGAGISVNYWRFVGLMPVRQRSER